ncbi:MAG: GtrA family protein [Capsulimonadaceae bacterium]|nr:GtrA family protein [Capsulimonadaceae bacterium]
MINVESDGQPASSPDDRENARGADDGLADAFDVAPAAVKRKLHERKGVRQFVKFCIVGGSSFFVNFAIFNILYHGKLHLSLVPALSIGFFVSVFNGFFWNRNWTFKEARATSVGDQYTKFLLVNIVGWFLNTGITVSLIAGFMVFVQHDHVDFWRIFWDIIGGNKKHYPILITNGALLGATGFVVFWNFFANRKWTFKH